jgi:hypothetical protein
MQSVTSNSVALAFKGMEVVECGKIYPDREAQDNWYIKYDCGLIEEWFLYSGVIPDMTSAGNIFMSYKMINFPIPLKSGTKSLSFEAKVLSSYRSTPNIWAGASNDGTDSNTQQSVGYYSWYRNTNMRTVNVSFHVVGFWK